MLHTSFEYRHKVRLKAAALFAEGKHSNSEIAHRLGVSKQSVSGWHQIWLSGGEAALSLGRPGRSRRISDEQLKQVEQALLEGPAAHGYETEFWTLERIADLVKKTVAITYHPTSIRNLLKSMGWSYQKPQRRAKQRDEELILRWKNEDWPRIKKGRKKQAQE